MIKQRLLLITLITSILGYSQIPAGYYSTATGSGYTLKTQLHNIIDNHIEVSYSDLWTYYDNTDLDTDGYIWDMYSENPGGVDPYNYTFSTDQCGSYSGEGSCYNREHSFPKSWFNDASPMFSDIFHVIPTDGYVNGQRSNFVYGEITSPTWTSQNGSKKGPARAGLGYVGTVFEPIDEFKGDFARIYFYMATRYEDIISGWSGSDMLDGSSNKVFETWALNMLIDWHTNDPVSQKEIDRNNYIYYNIQSNRNPYVDNPNYVNEVWGIVPGPSYCNQTLNESICSGSSYLFGGNNLTSAGQYIDTVSGVSCDTIYTLNLSVSNSITVNTSLSICESSFQFGSQTLTQTGLFTEVFDLGGCDSTVNLQLILNPVNTNITQDGNNLTADQNGAQYQWLDCQGEFRPIDGEINKTFFSNKRGFFAVEITNGSCKDTSTCIQLNDIDNVFESKGYFTNIYPNPSKGKINIYTNINNPKIEIINILGSKVKSTNSTEIDLSNLEKGVYFIKIYNKNFTSQERIILE